MNCPNCGAACDNGDRFCNKCGHPLIEPMPTTPQVTKPSPVFCLNCGAVITPGNRFCEQCGVPVGNDTQPRTVPAAQPTPVAGPESVVEPAPAPHVTPVVTGAGRTAGRSLSTPVIAAIVAAAVVVVAVAAFLIIRFVGSRDAGATAPGASNGATSSQSAPKSNGADKSDAAKTCTSAPEGKVDTIKSTGDGVIASVKFTSGCDAGTFSSKDVRVTLTEDGATVADAIFDFTKEPITSGRSGRTIELSYPFGSYWRPVDHLTSASSGIDVKVATGATPASDSTFGVGSALAAAPVPDADANGAAQTAIQWQIANDRNAANGFMTTITTQLSSKRDGLDAEGKTWHYQDIYEQYLTTKAKYPNTLLVDSSDWPTYRNTGTTGWYVLLSGERFPDTGSASSWCAAQGMSKDDCIPVDLQ
ncbi:zinc ribbon domain-containing protein [Bifidobacterium callitrichos]|nr:zinc ribbon domain-containing protein [Bifidobacterium callitrichos]